MLKFNCSIPAQDKALKEVGIMEIVLTMPEDSTTEDCRNKLFRLDNENDYWFEDSVIIDYAGKWSSSEDIKNRVEREFSK